MSWETTDVLSADTKALPPSANNKLGLLKPVHLGTIFEAWTLKNASPKGSQNGPHGVRPTWGGVTPPRRPPHMGGVTPPLAGPWDGPEGVTPMWGGPTWGSPPPMWGRGRSSTHHPPGAQGPPVAGRSGGSIFGKNQTLGLGDVFCQNRPKMTPKSARAPPIFSKNALFA